MTSVFSCRRALIPFLILISVLGVSSQALLTLDTNAAIKDGHQLSGVVALRADHTPVSKRFVLRTPPRWNGSLVIGAHGGGGGNNFDRSGNAIGTDETALDDVAGQHAFAGGFAYASFDRDGSNAIGVPLTYQFTEIMKAEVARRGGKPVSRTYLVGLSAGGGITRAIAEDSRRMFDGTLIIAGSGGDVATRLDRQTRVAALWPLIDPQSHYGLSPGDSKFARYAEAVGTPIAARRLWAYSGPSTAAAASRPAVDLVDSSAEIKVPTIEVIGTWDDLMIREVRAYRERVTPKHLHRLYQVEGVWHMSGDDDGVMSFQYIATARMKLDPDVANAMGEGPSYLPTVREAFDHLVRWVEKGVPAPESQTIEPGTRLR